MGRGPVAWQMSAHAQWHFSSMGASGLIVSVAVASCAEHSRSSASLGKSPFPIGKVWARMCSVLCLSGCFRLGQVLQMPSQGLGTDFVLEEALGSLGRAALRVFSFLMAPVWTQAHPDRIQILVAVVRYKTRLSKPRRGLCSTWLASLNPEQGNCLDSVRTLCACCSNQS